MRIILMLILLAVSFQLTAAPPSFTEDEAYTACFAVITKGTVINVDESVDYPFLQFLYTEGGTRYIVIVFPKHRRVALYMGLDHILEVGKDHPSLYDKLEAVILTRRDDINRYMKDDRDKKNKGMDRLLTGEVDPLWNLTHGKK